MGTFIDLTGQMFGRWKVLSRAENGSNAARWLCKCSCGTERIVSSNGLRRGRSLSCGCYHKELSISENTTHNLSRTELGKKWYAMKACCDPRNKDTYPYHAGKGITICEEWSGERGIKVFVQWGYDNGWNDGCELTLERKNGKLGYSPDNCTFANYNIQNSNQDLNSRNTSGKKGVCYHKKTNVWRAYLSKQGKRVFNGNFKTFEEAIEAREKAELEYFGHLN